MTTNNDNYTYYLLDPVNAKNIERIMVNHFKPRVNVIVPNVSWGLKMHECDILVLTKLNYAIEVEIKISKSDLIADKHKGHGHVDRKNRIKTLYFAIPEHLKQVALECCPERAGIIIVKGEKRFKYHRKNVPWIEIVRKPKQNITAIKFTDKERNHLLHLGIMRYWSCKSKLLLWQYKNQNKKEN